MSKRNGNQFSMDEYTRRTLDEKKRLRGVENTDVMRKKQKELFEKYGKKWMRGIGRALYPSHQWCMLFSFPLTLLEIVMGFMVKWYGYLTTGWRVQLSQYLYMGGVRHKVETIRHGVRRLSVIVKGKVVEEVEVRV